jgi:hypothetical protein
MTARCTVIPLLQQNIEWRLDAEEILTQPLTAGTLTYRALHETTIASEAPYSQLAIEFEIERLSITYGAAALPKMVRVLGPKALKGLQFLERRVNEGTEQTSLNERHLNQLLQDIPSALAVLTETAGMALKAYGQYLVDCLTLASTEAARCKMPGAWNSTLVARQNATSAPGTPFM